MGRRSRYRRWGKRARPHGYRSPLIRPGRGKWRGKWYQRKPWGAAVIFLFVLAIWAIAIIGGLSHMVPMPWVAKPTAQDPEAAWFQRCMGPVSTRYTCVVDGDTIYYRGENIRLIGYDTPELFSPECEQEEDLAEQARDMLIDLLNAGPFTLEKPALSQSTDQYGRALRRLKREGAPLGDQLISAGLAHRYGGGAKQGWCATAGLSARRHPHTAAAR